jgi:PEP-CTERM motif
MAIHRIFIALAAILLTAVGPAGANPIHGERSSSNQGLLADAFFDGTTSTVDGVTVARFDDQGTIFDVFGLPASFTSGTPVILSFNDITQGYGIFSCDNGSNNFGASADSPSQAVVGPCTVGSLNEQFVSFVEGVNTSTLTFVPGAGAPSQFFAWTSDGNLTGISGSGTTTVPEPGTLALVGMGLVGLCLLRRRTETLA